MHDRRVDGHVDIESLSERAILFCQIGNAAKLEPLQWQQRWMMMMMIVAYKADRPARTPKSGVGRTSPGEVVSLSKKSQTGKMLAAKLTSKNGIVHSALGRVCPKWRPHFNDLLMAHLLAGHFLGGSANNLVLQKKSYVMLQNRSLAYLVVVVNMCT